MKSAALFISLLYASGQVVVALPTKINAQVDASAQIAKWQKQYGQYINQTIKTRHSGCASDNVVYRQEWGSLSDQSRIEYTKAVQCLQQRPAISSKSDVPGARSRFDDFMASHIIQAPYIHFSGLFLHWHRYYVWLYEKALQEECDYKGTQPYWDWTLSWQDPRQSTVFDGSPTSLGSNGQYTPHGPTNVTAFGISLPIVPGTGGDCVCSGPFTNYTVNLGPHSFQPVDGQNGLDYNPRCLKRDISLVWSNQTKPTDVTALISGCTDLNCFDTVLEALNGVHAGGHFTIGGDPGNDPYASPGDPVFYLHHAQVDRLWAIWQNLDPAKRTSQVYGTSTANNVPPSPNVTLDTQVDFGVLSQKQPISSLISSVDGPFCYVYI